ncbi:MAG: hypothetical protein ACKVWR_10480 [Acidimicrobiales bacterium]
MTPRWRDEDGYVGGMEAMPFGILVFVVCILLVAQGWAVLEAKQAAGAAAREAARSFVEAGTPPAAALAEAHAVGLAALAAHGGDPAAATLRLDGPVRLVRCERVTFEATYTATAVGLALLGRATGALTVTARHSEVVDPYRSGLPGEASCARP